VHLISQPLFEGRTAVPRFSILIPARNEERFLPACLESIQAAAASSREQVEIIVALNRCTDRTEMIALAHGAKVVHEDGRNLSRIRNVAARSARGDIIMTIDADSRMSRNMLVEIDRLLATGRYIGGGVLILPERWSLGIVVTALLLVPIALRHRVSAGLFWCLRKDFEAIGGFNESFVSVEDLDFAKRLKAHGESQGKRYKTILKAHIVTSCRKFDIFGDWYLVRNPALLRQIFSGRSQKAANHFFYDVKR
jgi:glycosyltransferase involved in cell wall biosynthesis